MAEQTDLLILGGGTGGYIAAIRAAQKGLNVTVVEKNKVGVLVYIVDVFLQKLY